MAIKVNLCKKNYKPFLHQNEHTTFHYEEYEYDESLQ